jgi:hypothetical protein
MLVENIEATRRDAKWARAEIEKLIEAHHFRYSQDARRYYQMVGRCALYLNAEKPAPPGALEAVEGVPVESTLEAVREYDPQTEGVALWIPTDPPEGSPLGGMVLSGRFGLHPAFRAS